MEHGAKGLIILKKYSQLKFKNLKGPHALCTLHYAWDKKE